MRPATALGVLLLLVRPVGAAPRAQQTLAQRWSALEARPAGDTERVADAAALLFDAGELGPALVLCEIALEDRPQDLGLLWRAATIATSLRDAPRARRYADRLWAAVQDQVRADDAWQDSARSLEEEADRLESAARERVRRLHRARGTSGAVLALALFLLVAFLRAGRARD